METLVHQDDIVAYAQKRRQMCSDIKTMITNQLNLEISPEFITDDQPLFGRGLELDSIDALELAIGIYDLYELTLSDGDTSIFSSVNTMVDHVLENQDSVDSEPDEGGQLTSFDLDA